MSNQLTKDELKATNKMLANQLDGTNHKEILPQIRANELLIKELDKVKLLKDVNDKYSRLRALALQAYECEQPTEDITTADGSFHKSKVKKYPKIAALSYAYAKWEDNRFTQLRINGEKFNMFKVVYEYQKPNSYTRPETFAEFLELNSIPVNDITLEQYNDFSSKLKALNDKLKADIENYKNGLQSLNYSSLNYWGLIDQQNVNLYEYTARY